MKLYVQGDNLLAFLAEERAPMLAGLSAEQAREYLARWVARYCEMRDCDGRLVFGPAPDGEVRAPTRHFGPVTVTNCPPGVEARAEIAGPANRDAVEQRTLVVTDDWTIAEALRNGKARVLTPARFVAAVRELIGKDGRGLAAEPDEKFSGLSEDEVDLWMEYFDGED